MSSLTAADVETWIRVLSFVPIALCSVAGFAVALWKWQQLRRADFPSPAGLTRLYELLDTGDLSGALALVASDPSRAARIIRSLLPLAGRASARLDARAGQAGGEMARELEYGLGVLGMIATLGPLFGLLGTVVGITVVFNRLAGSAGLSSPQQLAGGIGTALHTTIAGLLVGVAARVSQREFAARGDQRIGQLETVATDSVERLSRDDD
jgi:biopolymer transport protein ExbB